MRYIFNFLCTSALSVMGTVGFAYDVGDVAYICTKNQKFAWVIGKDSWSSCPVRILQRAGESYKVLAHRESCILPGFGAGMISKGRDAWLESYDLWSSSGACEDQGKSKEASKPPEPKPAPAPSASNAVSFDIVVRIEHNIAEVEKGKSETDKLASGLFGIAAQFALASLKEDSSALRIANKCGTTVSASFKWKTSSGVEKIKQWNLEPSEGMKSYSLSVDGEPVADGKSSVLMHVRTTSGREIWAGSQDSANFKNGKAYFRDIQLQGQPRYIELCPE
jgi:hypothetical protein